MVDMKTSYLPFFMKKEKVLILNFDWETIETFKQLLKDVSALILENDVTSIEAFANLKFYQKIVFKNNQEVSAYYFDEIIVPTLIGDEPEDEENL